MLRKSADELSVKAEAAGSVKAVRENITKSNSHRKTAVEKDEEVQRIEKKN